LIAVTACSAYVLGILAFVLDVDHTPPTWRDDRLRATAPPPAAAEPTAAPSLDAGDVSSAQGLYRSEVFQYWHPPRWSVSEAGRKSVLQSPDADVVVSFAPARQGSLESIADGALADLEARYGDIGLLPADLTFAGRRSLALGGSASEAGGRRFIVIAVSRPAGSATITMTFGPHATRPRMPVRSNASWTPSR
jgi:hypothetical protein